MSVLLAFLGLAQAPLNRNEEVKEQAINVPDDREEMRLAQIESYLSAEDNQGVANLALYL